MIEKTGFVFNILQSIILYLDRYGSKWNMSYFIS